MKHIIALAILFVFQSHLNGQVKPVALIPFPQQTKFTNEIETFSNFTFYSDTCFQQEQEAFEIWLKNQGITGETTRNIAVYLKKETVKNPFQTEGAYNLSVSNQIRISAETAAGIFYGIQTLKQLLEYNGTNFSISHCEIADWPAFEIRGFMHDLGRNYQSPELLKEQIDVMAAYKYNVFHLHITDNPGWRLESKIYPKLQAEEATSRKPGKFYTQKEFKEIVEYCRQRHITVIPEIDVPGHSAAFRKALGIKSMNTPEVQQILLNLIDELCSLESPEIMPYIHLGTDEVWEQAEKVDPGFLVPLIQKITQNGRKYISWWHGIETPGDLTSVKQLWAQAEPPEGHPFIDSRSNYINHLDPLAGIGRLFFQQPCRAEHGDSLRLGGILCCWPDNRVEEERSILLQNSVYPFMVTYSQAIWHGVKSTGNRYWAQLPPENSTEYKAFQEFENRLAIHRQKYFQEKEFPFVKNSAVPWKIIGPIDHHGNFSKSFEVEKEIKDHYQIEGQNYRWNDTILFGGTIHLKHFFGFPSPVQKEAGTVYALNYLYSPTAQEVDFWIGFQNWSRSGRRGGPTPQLGQWHFTLPKIWVNNQEIEPPAWKQPGLDSNTTEIPFLDEDYYYREPAKVKLNKGWNKFLLKIPFGQDAWKWMFTCIPVRINEQGVQEITGIEYTTEKLTK